MRWCAAAPPSQDRPSAIALDAEIGDTFRIERLEPDEIARVVDAAGLTTRNDGNNVSLDTETLIDEKTALQYQLLSGAMSSKFGLIDTVLKG